MLPTRDFKLLLKRREEGTLLDSDHGPERRVAAAAGS
jgi:hypothetical protein